MSNKEIGDLYRGIRRQDKYDKPEKLEDMYGEVLREASVVFTYDDGTTETVEVSDKNAKALRGLSNTSVARADALVRTSGDNWSGTRGQAYALQMLDQMKETQDWKKMDDRIIKIAKEATIFDEAKEIKGYNNNLDAIRRFLIDSAKKTLEARGQIADGPAVKREVGVILTNIETGKYQGVLIDNLEARCNSQDTSGPEEKSSGVTCTFPLWEVMLPKDGMGGTLFDVKNHEEMLILRPYTDEAATRGAAGPGEALMSFIYGGIKPQGAGDVLLNSAPGDSIELKKQKGRIGKDIQMDSKRKKYLESLFYPKTGIAKPLQSTYKSKYTDLTGYMVEEMDQMTKLKFPLPRELYGQRYNIEDNHGNIHQGGGQFNIPSQVPAGGVDQFTGEADPTGITVFPVSVITAINNSLKVQGNEWIGDALAAAGFKSKKGVGTIMAAHRGNLDAAMIAGSFKHDSIEHLQNMSVEEFVEKASGAGLGKYYTKDDDGKITVPGNDEGEEYELSVELVGFKNAWDCISQCPGVTPMDRIGNLIGVYHLKYYLTHIASFRWLLVYEPEGTAAGISREKVVVTPIMDLLQEMSEKGLFFGMRKDSQGFDIQVDAGLKGE